MKDSAQFKWLQAQAKRMAGMGDNALEDQIESYENILKIGRIVIDKTKADMLEAKCGIKVGQAILESRRKASK